MPVYKTPEEFIEHIKMQKTELTTKCCISEALDLISGKWEMKILFQLMKYDVLRFGEFKKLLPGITNTMLTKTLKKFEEEGIVHREQFNEVPPHVEYSLTKNGKYLIPIFFELAKWADLRD